MAVTFLKANIASLGASLADYSVSILLVSGFHAGVVPGSMAGTITGGVLNFLMGRHWVFVSKHHKITQQASRYILVWTGNLILNTTGVYLLAQVAGCNYTASKIITSVLVAVTYNYLLQKKFVFKTN